MRDQNSHSAAAWRQPDFASPYRAAARAYATNIIEPGQTRAQVALALRKLSAKRDVRPPKKHGNIPLWSQRRPPAGKSGHFDGYAVGAAKNHLPGCCS
jgi:hypothetical protein